jgi:predicted O-linked N-acetylglucosamine transferase (SPINDLY family)
MDYLLTDALHSPASDAQRFTEELVRLPRIRFCFRPPDGAPPIAAKARNAGAPVLGSFNRMAKISARTLEAWSAALARIPGARLVVKNSALEQPREREFFAARFAERGIDPARIEWRGFSTHARMLDEYNEIDVVLDTFPYNGGITTMEALWMGRPVATIRGDTMVSRQSAALLEAAGLPEGIAGSASEFAATVERLLGALPAQEIRARLAASPLMDGTGLARALEETYRSLWRRWTEGS